jgi:hypothetical protein
MFIRIPSAINTVRLDLHPHCLHKNIVSLCDHIVYINLSPSIPDTADVHLASETTHILPYSRYLYADTPIPHLSQRRHTSICPKRELVTNNVVGWGVYQVDLRHFGSAESGCRVTEGMSSSEWEHE